jgi:ADP-ribosylglycohydrolase
VDVVVRVLTRVTHNDPGRGAAAAATAWRGRAAMLAEAQDGVLHEQQRREGVPHAA